MRTGCSPFTTTFSNKTAVLSLLSLDDSHFQNVARWEPGHRLEAYATLACRRGCRWSADLPAGAFETSFQHSGKLMYHRLPACVGFPAAFPRREPSQTTLIFSPFNPGLSPVATFGAQITSSTPLQMSKLHRHFVPGYYQLSLRDKN